MHTYALEKQAFLHCSMVEAAARQREAFTPGGLNILITLRIAN